MALSYSTVFDNAQHVDRLQKGTNCNIVDVTIGVASDDYSSGLTVVGSKFGIRQIAHVTGVSVRTSLGALKGQFYGHWDGGTDKLRLYHYAASTAAALSEVAASHLANGDVVRAVFFGV